MSEAPSWLSAPAPAPTTTSLEVDTPAPASNTNLSNNMNNNGATSGSSAADEKELPSIILTMRLANMAVAVFTIVISIFTMISGVSLSTFVLGIYATCGGLLICCLETQLKFLRVIIAVNFGFLFNSTLRFVFYLVLGSVMWSFEEMLGRIVAIALIVVAFYNTYILCRYPAYRKIRDQVAEEEDKRIEARISKEVKRQAINQVLSGNNNQK